MNFFKKIQAIQNALEKVNVAGPENWNRMLACWQTLGEIKEELNYASTENAVQQSDTKNAADTV